jgi:hypothetical protein
MNNNSREWEILKKRNYMKRVIIPNNERLGAAQSMKQSISSSELTSEVGHLE